MKVTLLKTTGNSTISKGFYRTFSNWWQLKLNLIAFSSSPQYLHLLQVVQFAFNSFVCWSICLLVHIWLSASIHLFVCQYTPVCLSVHTLSVHLSVHICLSVSTHLSVCQYMYCVSVPLILSQHMIILILTHLLSQVDALRPFQHLLEQKHVPSWLIVSVDRRINKQLRDLKMSFTGTCIEKIYNTVPLIRFWNVKCYFT